MLIVHASTLCITPIALPFSGGPSSFFMILVIDCEMAASVDQDHGRRGAARWGPRPQVAPGPRASDAGGDPDGDRWRGGEGARGGRWRDTGGVGDGVRVAGEGEWSRYWRSEDEPLEAMHAYFREHVYHRHSHDTYSFGVTESGAQSFTCRGAAHTSAAGMVMAFNPDDPHDGHPTTGQGFSYRMIHVGPGLLAEALTDIGGGPAGRPLFAAPVLADPGLAAAVRRLHQALTGPSTPLERGERLTVAVGRAARAAAWRPP